MGNEADGLLTVEELAGYLGVSVSTIYNRRYRGDDLPPSYRIGKAVRYRRRDVEAWLEEQADERPDAA